MIEHRGECGRGWRAGRREGSAAVASSCVTVCLIRRRVRARSCDERGQPIAPAPPVARVCARSEARGAGVLPVGASPSWPSAPVGGLTR